MTLSYKKLGFKSLSATPSLRSFLKTRLRTSSLLFVPVLLWSMTAQAQVTLYQHCNFEGKAVTLPIGSHDYNAMIRAGVKNDDVSSVKVSDGYAVALYQHSGFKGTEVKLTNDLSCLVNKNFNDQVSSLKVISTKPAPPPNPAKALPSRVYLDNAVRESKHREIPAAGGLCLEMNKFDPKGDGYNVQTTTNCNSKWKNQRWASGRYGVYTSHSALNGNYCLTAEQKNRANVTVKKCNLDDKNQKFKTYADGSIRIGNNFCLDVLKEGLPKRKPTGNDLRGMYNRALNASQTRKNKVILYQCHGGKNQIFGYPETSDSSVSFVKMHGSFTCNANIKKDRTDGCSVPRDWEGFDIDWAFDDDNYKKFKSACTSHDICYSSPWDLKKKSNGQRHCDADFRRDLLKICDVKHNDGSPNWMTCRVTAESMYAAVRDHGGKSFKGGQKWATNTCQR